MENRSDREEIGAVDSLQVLLQAQGELFRMFEVFSAGSALVQSPEVPKEAVRVKARTTELVNDQVPFGL